MAFRWKFCGNMEVKAVLIGLLVFFFTLNEAGSDCNYFQILENGKTYYAYNPDYSNMTEGKINCAWQITYSHNITINCNIDIPTETDCVEQSLSVHVGEKKPEVYCGKGPTRDLTGEQKATITFDLSYQKVGRFLCKIRGEPPIDENNCKCGQHNNNNVTRIVGGNETGVNEYPMMSGLVDIDKKMIYCGATIIAEQYVVTAAHCIEKRDITEIGVVVGEHDVTTGAETNATQLFRVLKCTIHPQYNEKEIQNDIAVCTISGTIKYSAEVGPVCLPFKHKRNPFDGNIVTALGWGLLEFAGEKATKLQKVYLNVTNLVKCKEDYPYVTDKNMCTYTPKKDTCQMDSGGPVLWQDPATHNLVLVGITSNGIGCGSNEPAIETRTGAFVDWIESVTSDASYCKIE